MGFSLNLYMLYNNKTGAIFNHMTAVWHYVGYIIGKASDDVKLQCFSPSDLLEDTDDDIVIRKFSTVEISVDDPNRKRNMGISPGLFIIYDSKASIVFNPKTKTWIDVVFLANEASSELKLQCLMTNRSLDDPIFGDVFLNNNGDASFINKNSRDITTRMSHLVEELA